MEITPAGVMSMWAAGLAAGLAAVATQRIVGRGYVWLAAGVTGGFGLLAALASPTWWAFVGVGLALAAVPLARQASVVVAVAVASATCLGVAAVLSGMPALATVSGLVFLGAVTTEMMLGHWYLVDPRLPRPVLRAFAVVAVVGAVADGVVVIALGAIPWESADMVLGWGFVVLGVTSATLMVLVRLALGERGYSGVMAATGLSYLGVLTAIGAVVVGRMLAV